MEINEDEISKQSAVHYNKLDEMLDKISTQKGQRFHMRREKYSKKEVDEDDFIRNLKKP